MNGTTQADLARLEQALHRLTKAHQILVEAFRSAQIAHESTSTVWLGPDRADFGADLEAVAGLVVLAGGGLGRQVSQYRQLIWDVEHGQP